MPAYPFIIVFPKLHVRGMALFPFILLRERSLARDAVIMNHELIHHRQQVELLIIPFYFFYLLHYIINRFRFPDHHSAYRHIIFEKEAYANESNLNYLEQRKWFGFWRYSK